MYSMKQLKLRLNVVLIRPRWGQWNVTVESSGTIDVAQVLNQTPKYWTVSVSGNFFRSNISREHINYKMHRRGSIHRQVSQISYISEVIIEAFVGLKQIESFFTMWEGFPAVPRITRNHDHFVTRPLEQWDVFLGIEDEVDSFLGKIGIQ